MKKQRILSALLALCIVFSLVPTALAEKADDFTDVSRSDWYYQFVDYVTSKGYFNGVADKTFAPADNMTRAMFVTVLFRFHGAKGDSSQSAFVDVAPGEWYTAAINWAAANKIVDGVGNGKFAPNDPITRAQMCTMIERYLDLYRKAWKVTLPETGSVSVMVDESAIPAYALAAVKQCQRHGLVNGFEDGTFRPNDLSTRAQVAAVIYRMSYLVQNAKPDNTPSVNPPVNPPVTAYTYALYFDANGGTLNGASPVSMTTTSTTYSFPVTATATRDGYTFLGWATEKTATAATYPANSTITLTANYPIITLYAVWQAKAPVVVSEDLIGNAVLKSVKQVNDRFNDMKNAVVSAVDQVNKDNKYLTDAQLQQVKNIVNDMVKVEDVKANFTSGDNKTEREVTWNVALEVKDGQVVSAIEQANKIADAIITGTTSKPTPDDIDGFLTSVKNAVESETGIVLTNKSLSEIKTQVVDLLKKEGKSLWANFHDGKGNYVCGNVDVVFNGKTYATVQVGASSASLSAAKSKIVKELGTAISKEIYKQMKAQGTAYTDNFTFNIDLKVNFAPSATNADIKAKTDNYTYNYKLVVTPKLNSNGLLEYKYEGNENYLRLNISKDIQKAYNDGLDQIAAQFTYNDGTKDKVVAEAQKGLKKEIPALYKEVTEALAKYDIKLTNTTVESIENALMPVVESWVDTNWTEIVKSTTSGGTLKGLDNTALINAVWPLIEQDINALDVNALIENQISEKLTEKKINEAWIVDKANNSGTLKDAKDLVKGFDAVTFEPAGVTLDIQSVADINFLLAQPEIKAHVTKGGFGATITLSGKGGKPFSDALKQEIVDTATKELDTALNSSATLKDLLAKNPGLKNYLIYSALVQMGLTFDTEKAANASALDNLKPTIKDEGKAKLAEKLNNKLGAIDVSSILNDGSAEKVEAQKKIDLLNSLKFDAANGIQTKKASELAAALKGPTMMDIVGNKGDTYVAQYVEKLVNKVQTLLPDGASITIAGVTLTENDLNELKAATTTKAAVTALANLIEKFGDLSIGSFADPAGQKVTVNYNTRSASANLIINVK
ncbi:S-layer homology domain-containing protein [Oscillospiraceae bacterium HCN-4035]